MADSDRKFLRDYYEHQSKALRNHQELMYSGDDLLGTQRLAAIQDIIFTTRALSLLDVGCAEGLYIRTFVMNKGCGLGVGIDIAVGYIRKAAKKSRLGSYIVSEGTSIPFKESSFELVLCSEVLEHVQSPEDVLRELIRVSARYILVTTPGHTLPYYASKRLFPNASFRKQPSPFGSYDPGYGHINEIGFKEFLAWARRFHCRVVFAHALHTLAIPGHVGKGANKALTRISDPLVNLLPLEWRKGCANLVLFEKTESSMFKC